jgi:dienelactone hydrolase
VTTVPDTYEHGRFGHDTSGGYLAWPVHRREGPGRTVILIHEVPGISATTLAIADRLAGEGYTIVVPEILRAFPFGPPIVRTGVTIAAFCVAGTMSALSANRTGMVVEWLRGLARRESARDGDRPVGVIGMCFSGGFALGAILEPSVGAGVLSQPSLPFAISSRHKLALGVSETDLQAIKARVGRGGRLRIMRYERDALSPSARYDRFVSEFPDAGRCTIATEDPGDHSVLADAIGAPDDSELGRALRETLAFLEANLRS